MKREDDATKARTVWEFVEGRLSFGAAVRAGRLDGSAPNRHPGTHLRAATETEREFRMSKRCFETYDEALCEAKRVAKELGRGVGLLRVRSPRKGWHEYFSVFLLPPKSERAGYELRCEVVFP